MSFKSTLRGYPIVFNKEADVWYFVDTGEPTKETYKNRPCCKCGEALGVDDSDPCLGHLPGVDNACCGHGDISKSYIQFTNGVIVQGFIKALNPTDTTKGDKDEGS